jgi:hypothetical protein
MPEMINAQGICAYGNSVGFVRKITNSSGTVRVTAAYGATITQATPGDGHIFYIPVLCRGDETVIVIRESMGTTRGKYDLWINGVLDSSGYDNYNVTSLDNNRQITLTRKILPGLNEIELRVNGKNASSANYNLYIYGVLLW